MPSSGRLTLDSAASYAIRVQGYLDSSWSERMGGVDIQAGQRADGAPETVLSGVFQDQAALAGALNLLYDLGLPLLAVERLHDSQPESGSASAMVGMASSAQSQQVGDATNQMADGGS